MKKMYATILEWDINNISELLYSGENYHEALGYKSRYFEDTICFKMDEDEEEYVLEQKYIEQNNQFFGTEYFLKIYNKGDEHNDSNLKRMDHIRLLVKTLED